MKKQSTPNSSLGFTLIEILIYLALFSFLFAGVFSAVAVFFESNQRDNTSAFIEEEGIFLVGKINGALQNVQSIQSPTATSTMLLVTQGDGSTLKIHSIDSQLRIQVGDAPEVTLNSSGISVTSLVFTRHAAPEGVSVSFTLSATTSDGHVVPGQFSTIDYLSL